jgi:hypothetical protein
MPLKSGRSDVEKMIEQETCPSRRAHPEALPEEAEEESNDLH